jgi:ketosteroid isomerase-like protein
MRMKSVALGTVAALVASRLPAQAPQALADSLTGEWVAAYNAGDVDRLVELVAEDVVLMLPDHAPVRGRAAYRATYAEDIRSTPRRSLSTRSLRVEQAGDLLVDTGEWQFVGNGSDGAAVHLNGSYVTVWKRLDGWRTVIDLSTRRAP